MQKRISVLVTCALAAILVLGILTPAAFADSLSEGNWVYEITTTTSDGFGGGDGGDGAPSDMEMPDDMGDGTAPDDEGMGDMEDMGDGTAPDDADMGDMDGTAPSDGEDMGDMGGEVMGDMSSSSTSTATLLWGLGDESSASAVLIPAVLGDTTVTTLGSGAQNVMANISKSNAVGSYVLIPEGVTTISARAFYDCNNTLGWSIPESVTSIESGDSAGSFLSSPGTIYGVSDSAAESFADEDSTRDFVTQEEDGGLSFTISMGENGYIQPNGTYYVPSAMLSGEYTISISMTADVGYKIESLTVDGTEIAEAVSENTYTFDYTFSESSSLIAVTFTEDPDDTREPEDTSVVYDAPEITEGAVADGVTLQDDVYDYAPINTGSTAKYTNTMGISTGEYYAADGTVYETFESIQDSELTYSSIAEVINAMYEENGWVYGEDYDYIRLYNYYENTTDGVGAGEKMLYCAYLYKELEDSSILDGATINVESGTTNTATIFVQEGGDLTITDLTTYNETSGLGPSEAGNFFGLGSAIHVDGGDNVTAATNTFNEDTALLTLINPNILGTINSMYAAASGVLKIQGGNVFSCSSGGHGPYVSTGGQIYLNTDDTNLILDDGSINTDTDTLVATTRPSGDIGTMTRNEDGEMEGVYEEHADDVTAIVTGDEAGTALATDTGGGVIVANQVTTKTYGLRCAGVYSIGSNESWVYTYNSTLQSMLDAGLCSASGGYIYAFNCDISGVMGIKTRAGGETSSEETGVTVVNCRVSAEYDAEEMISAYDVASPDDWDDSMADQGTGSDQLNIFIDKANTPTFYEDSLDWWFTDKSKTPGYSGGNKFCVIYVENASTPITVEQSYLVNQNYLDYGDASTLEEGQTPADNLLISVESGGSGDVTFINENSDTLWDLTGENDETCELNGDFYLGATSESDGPDAGSGANTLTATFENSEWTGAVILEDGTGVCNLSFDADSSWVVTADCVLGTLTVADASSITAETAVTITYTSLGDGTDSAITDGATIGNVTYVQE